VLRQRSTQIRRDLADRKQARSGRHQVLQHKSLFKQAPVVAPSIAAGCVYLSFLGGGCPLLSDAIKDIVAVA